MSDFPLLLQIDSAWPSGMIQGVLAVVIFLALVIGVLYKFGAVVDDSPQKTLKLLQLELAFLLLLHLSMLLDGHVAPKAELIASLLCHSVYSLHLLNFPNLTLVSFNSLASFLAFIVSHAIWFNHFRYCDGDDMLTLVMFYVIMVWLVPSSLILSLDVSELDLPVYKSPNQGYSEVTVSTAGIAATACSPSRIISGSYSPVAHSYDKWK